MADANPKITITADDQASPALNTIAAALKRLEQAGEENLAWVTQLATSLTTQQQATSATTQSTTQLASAYHAMAISIQEQTRGYTQAQAAMLAYKQQQDQVREASRGATQELQQGAGALRMIGSVAAGLGIATTVQAAAGQLVAFAKSVIDVGARLQTLRVSLNAVAGGTQQGQEAFQFITDTANKFGLSLTGLATAYKGLTAASAGTALEGKQTQQIFTAVAAASRTLGLTTEASTGVLLALQQMMSKGTTQAEELRGQLGERLPGAFNIAARAMGVSTAELGKMLEAGQVISAEFLPKFAAQLQRELGGGATAAATTASVAFQKLENEWMALKERIAKQGPLQFVVKIVDAAGNLLREGRLQEEAKQAAAARQAQLAQVVVAPGARPRPGTLEGATPQEIDELANLDRQLQGIQSTRQPQTFMGRLMQDTRELLGTQERLAAVEQQAQAQIAEIITRITQRSVAQQGVRARTEGLGTDQQTEEQDRQRALAVQNKALADVFETTRKQVAGVTALNKIAPERLGDTTTPSDRRVAELNSLLKIEREQLEAAAVKARDLGTALDETQTKNLEGLRASIRGHEADIEKIKETDKANSQAESRAARAADAAARREARAEETQAQKAAALLAKLRAQQEEESVTADQIQSLGYQEAAIQAGNRAEDMALRQTVAQAKLGAETEATALAIQHQTQAARAIAAAEQEWEKAQKSRRQAQWESLDILGLTLDPETDKSQRAHADYLEKLQEQLRVLRAPKLDRLEEQLRTRAPDNVVLPDEEAALKAIQAQVAQNAQLKAFEDGSKRVARDIEQTFSTLWENVLTGGVSSFRDMGLQIAQALQKTFATISAQLMQALLNGLAGTTAQEGGWAGALVGVVSKVATSALMAWYGGGTSTATEAASAIQGFRNAGFNQGVVGGSAGGNVFPGGLGTIRQMAAGGIVTQPSWTTLAEQGRPEAVVPLSGGRSIPVEMTGAGRPQEPQSIILQVQNHISYEGAFDPRILKTSKAEIIQTVAKDISADGTLRKIILDHRR